MNKLSLNKSTTSFHLFSAVVLSFLIFSTQALAERQKSDFSEPRATIGDGKDGRVWNNLRTSTKNRPVESVRIRLRKLSGGDDAYVNLRFDGSSTLENGKRVFLGDNNSREAVWNAGNVHPNGKQLVLNAYKGEILVESVEIFYAEPIDDGRVHRQRPYPGELRAGRGTLIEERGHRGREYRYGRRDRDERDYRDRDSDSDYCRSGRFRRPRIEIYRVKQSGGFFFRKVQSQWKCSRNLC